MRSVLCKVISHVYLVEYSKLICWGRGHMSCAHENAYKIINIAKKVI